MIGVGTLRFSDTAKKYVQEVMESNRLSYGPFCRRFEAMFAGMHASRFAILSNSGTSALQVALAALKERYGWEDGDQVLVPALTFVATVNTVIQNGLEPVLVDVEPDYYGIHPQLIEEKIGARTRAIMPVHLFGMPCEMTPIMEIASRRGLRVVEDSCETMFATYRDRPTGSFGDIGCFSTYVAHLITTGVGGINTTNDPQLAVIIRSLVNHGRDEIYISIDDDKDRDGEELRMIISRRFSFERIGYSYRVTELEAAVGLAALEDWEPMIAARRRNAETLTRLLSPLSHRIQLPAIRPRTTHSFMMYPVVLREDRKEEVTNFFERSGIETRDMLPILPQPVYRRTLNLEARDYPNADYIDRHGFYIGCHQELSDRDLEYIAERFHHILEPPRTTIPARVPAVRNTLVIAVHNESIAAQRIYDQIPLAEFQEVVVVDGGSTDGTREFYENKGHKVLSFPDMKKGEAIRRALGSVRGEFVVLYGADGSEDPSDLTRLLYTLERGADMVIASRFLPGSRRFDGDRLIPYRGMGNRVVSRLASFFYRGKFTDAANGFRAIRRQALERMRLTVRGPDLGYQMSLQAARLGLQVHEIPTWEYFAARRKGLGQLIRSLLVILKLLASEWTRKLPGHVTVSTQP